LAISAEIHIFARTKQQK